MTRAAEISACGTYRYTLSRVWECILPTVGWIMLNPSTADAEVDDPTIRRCVGFARDWGYGGITVRNLFALRATDPKELRRHPDPVGPDNDAALLAGVEVEDGLTVCAWGAHGPLHSRERTVVDLLTRDRSVRLHHLGLTRAGSPRHPLYLPSTTRPVEWDTRG